MSKTVTLTEKCTGHKIWVLLFSTTFVRTIFLSDKYSASYDREACRTLMVVRLFLPVFNENWYVLTNFSISPQHQTN
jgi:hypothetical protein